MAMIARGRRMLPTMVLVCGALQGCIAWRAGGERPVVPRPAADGGAPVQAPALGYRTSFVGRYPEGAPAFAERVGRALAHHPTLGAARPGDGKTPLHLELTLTNRSNGLLAGVSGLACGVTFPLLPAYARDDFELDVELRDGERSVWRRQYHDAVATIMHFTLVFASRAEQPRVVVEDVVDDLVQHALDDLAASGALGVP